jgi:large subunit ribosomal protein L35
MSGWSLLPAELAAIQMGLCGFGKREGVGAAVFLDSKPSEITACFTRVRTLYCALFLEENCNMRRPKGIKTRKAVAKRFKITATGKVLRSSAGKRHLLASKSPKRRRGLSGTKLVDPTDTYRILQNLPFSH